LRQGDAAALERCVAGGGVAVFPTDTLYGLGCDPGSETAVQRMYEVKGRAPEKPSAVMFFRLEDALAALGELGPRTRSSLARLLPGPVTVIVPDPGRRFALAGGDRSVGLRVPRLEGALLPLAGVRTAILQTSANRPGGAEARRLADVPAEMRAAADLVLDGGELPGLASTVVDLTPHEDAGSWKVLRAGALAEEAVAERLSGEPG
jgi:L-threonylcarbamoyladenylate synthase